MAETVITLAHRQSLIIGGRRFVNLTKKKIRLLCLSEGPPFAIDSAPFISPDRRSQSESNALSAASETPPAA